MTRTILAAALALGLCAPAMAMPVAPVAPGDAAVVQVYGGCGLLGHRGPFGRCRAGGQLGGYAYGRACPRGWHLGRFGGRCHRNWF